jgi:hypothetical protein
MPAAAATIVLPNSSANPLPRPKNAAKFRCLRFRSTPLQKSETHRNFDFEGGIFRVSGAIFPCRQGNGAAVG